MLVNIYSVIFFTTLYFHGVGFLKIINKFTNLDFFKSNLRLNPIYPLISIFFLSNQLLILNYFFSINNILLPFYLINFYIVFIGFVEKKQNSKKIYLFFIPFILSFSTFIQKINIDVETYGILYQFLVRNSKLILGNVEIFWRLGLNGILSYLNSILWLNNNFIFVHLISVVVISAFFIFLYEGLLKSKNKFYFFFSFYLILYSFLDNFGVAGGANGFINFQMTGAVDSIIAVYSILAVFYTFYLIQESKLSSEDYLLISIIMIFIVQIKTTGAPIVFSYLVLNYYYIKFNSINLKKFLKVNFALYLLGFLYLVKNVLSSGCLIYPVKILCFKNLKWYNQDLYGEVSRMAKEWYLAFEVGQNFITWLNQWLKIKNNFQITANFFISFFLIYIIYKIFTNKKKNPVLKIYFLQILFGFLFWMFTLPTPRFALTFFALAVAIFSFKSSEFKFELRNINYLIATVFLFSLIFTNRLDSYKSYYLYVFNDYEITSNVIKNLNNHSKLAIPDELDVMTSCVNVNNCQLEFSKYKFTKKYNYKIMEPKNIYIPKTVTHEKNWENFIFYNN